MFKWQKVVLSTLVSIKSLTIHIQKCLHKLSTATMTINKHTKKKKWCYYISFATSSSNDGAESHRATEGSCQPLAAPGRAAERVSRLCRKGLLPGGWVGCRFSLLAQNRFFKADGGGAWSLCTVWYCSAIQAAFFRRSSFTSIMLFCSSASVWSWEREGSMWRYDKLPHCLVTMNWRRNCLCQNSLTGVLNKAMHKSFYCQQCSSSIAK